MKKNMKKAFMTILFLFVLFCSSFADGKRKVAVYPLLNPTGESWINNLGKSVTDTVTLSLAMMGNFNIETPGILPSDFEEKKLADIAEKNGFDNIVFGSCSANDGIYRVGISIFDLSRNVITDTAEEEFYSLLDSFDAADNLVNVLMENLSGEKVYFGSLSVKPDRDEPYRTEVNGVDVGLGFTGSEKIITGKHEFDFYQNRGMGDELIDSIEIEVMMRKQAVIKPSIPWLTEREALENSRIRSGLIRNYFKKENTENVNSLFTEAFDFSENSYLLKYRKGIRSFYSELKKEYFTPLNLYKKYKKSIENSNVRIIDKIFVKDIHRRSDIVYGTDVATKLSLINTKARTYSSFVCDYDADITVDGKADDWEKIKSVFNDLDNDSKVKNKSNLSGFDIARAGIAIDSRYLYCMIETAGKKYRRDCSYEIIMGLKDVIQIQYFPGGGNAEAIFVPERKWKNSKEIYISLEKAVDEIIEIAIPLTEVEKYFDTESYTVDFEYNVKDKSSGKNIDYYNLKVNIPTIYYKLTGEGK